ncbi:MAG: hypothetical protein AAF361_14365 [Bacteroidota bacterium]
MNCSKKIENALMGIKDITNVYLYPEEALIVFSFVKANELAEALNALTDLGYPPKGDSINPDAIVNPACICMRTAREAVIPSGFRELYPLTAKTVEKQLDIAS